ncbi:MAG: CPBP family intramembrane glutamic endopeptidase [Bacteroidota bacterium]
MKTNQHIYPSWLQLLGLFGIYLLGAAVASIIAIAILVATGIDMDTAATHPLVILLTIGLGTGFTTWFAVRKSGGVSQLNWKKGTSVGIVVLAMLAIWSLTFVSSSLLMSFVPNAEAMVAELAALFQPSVGTVIAAVILAPILEEVLFRGVILKGLLQKYGHWKAILISAVVFGIIHFHPLQAINAMVIGIVLGFVYWRTRSLMAVIILHFINNSFAFLLGTTTDLSEQNTRELIGNDVLFALALIGSLLLGIFLLRTIKRMTPEAENDADSPDEELEHQQIEKAIA